MSLHEKLFEIADTLNNGGEVAPVTVRTLLSWASAQRRGSGVVWWIRDQLSKKNLVTQPDFESAYIDSPIEFILAQSESRSSDSFEEMGSSAANNDKAASGAEASDPTYLISKLAAANKPPLSISPDALLAEAVTLMLANDFSQMPVMTSERDVKGVVSWASIGVRLSLGCSGTHVRDFMEPHPEVKSVISLFQAIPTIAQQGYVLTRGVDNKITGIVTASDLSLQFQQLAEPFLLLGEIENYIRRLIEGKFSQQELTDAKAPGDQERGIETVYDMNFGEYIRLVEKSDRWDRLKLTVDRVAFCKELEQVRRIRNDVMHFDPDGIPISDLEKLREFSRFLQKLKLIGVI